VAKELTVLLAIATVSSLLFAFLSLAPTREMPHLEAGCRKHRESVVSRALAGRAGVLE
jgi:hypothetical protein